MARFSRFEVLEDKPTARTTCRGYPLALAGCCVIAGAQQASPEGNRSDRPPSVISSRAPSPRGPRAGRSQIERAKQLMEAGSNDRAMALLRDILREEPNNADAHLLLGTLLALAPKQSEAVAELQRAVELNPTSARAYYTLGTAQARFVQLKEARAALEKAIELDPRFADAHVSLALVLVQGQQKEFALARQHLERAITLQSKSPSAAYSHLLLAQILVEQNELPAALRELETATHLRPGYAEAYLSEGSIKKKQRDDAGAIEAFKKAVELAPNDSRAQYQLGAVLLRNGQASQAAEHLLKASQLQPPDRQELYQLCRALQKAGRVEEARACEQKLSATIQAGLAESAGMLTASQANNEGVELEKEGNVSAAVEKYRNAIKLYPSETLPRRNLALALCRLGRWEEGIVELKEVLRQNPEDAEATKALYAALEHVRPAKTDGPDTDKRQFKPK